MFEPRSHFESRLTLIVGVNVVLDRTVVVDSDWRFDNQIIIIIITNNNNDSVLLLLLRMFYDDDDKDEHLYQSRPWYGHNHNNDFHFTDR